MGSRARLSAAFVSVIQRHRRRRGMSQEALAHSSGVHRTYIGMLERGERNPTVDVAAQIADALGEPLSKLIREAEGSAGRR